MQPAGLAWVSVAGRPTHVSRFAALPPRRRPRAECPECGRPLTLKLGHIRRHHAAHAPGDRCVATNPETALHIDVKFHIASALTGAIGSGLPLMIRRRCAGAGPASLSLRSAQACDALHDYAWTRDWDEVIVEPRLGAAGHTRPDILLRRGGRPIAAIEVLVSHAVDEEKAAALETAAVPWVEVSADVDLLAIDAGWTVATPLSVAADGVGANGVWGAWRCARHDQAHRDLLTAAGLRNAAAAGDARHRSVLRGARVVDVYHAAGTRDRLIYRVEEQLLDGAMHALVLRAGTREIARAPANDSLDSRNAAWRVLRLAHAADVERLAAGGFADSPMRWASGDSAANLVEEALSDLPSADPTPLATRYPRRWFYARERGEWFLPREMRRVRWDRTEPDAFAAHPAWAASRTAVRERPVPAPSWKSFVFASRPVVAAFAGAGRMTQAGPVAVIDVSDEPARVRRALVVLTAPAEDEEVRRVDRSLADAGVEHVWLSHPRDWTSARGDLAWAAAGRDARGIGVVVVDGAAGGVYRAEHFARAFARGQPRLGPEAVRASMAERVTRLGG